MELRDSNGRLNIPVLAWLSLPPTLSTLILWVTSENESSAIAVICALILLILPWYSYQQWRKSSEGLPLFAIISFIYWLYYAFPLFWGDRTVLQADIDKTATEDGITQAMLMVVAGVLSLKIGMLSKLSKRLRPSHLPTIELKPSRLHYLRAVLGVGIVTNLFETSPYLFGEGGRQVILTFITIIPMIPFAILFREYMRGNSSRWDKYLIAAFLLVRIVVGIASGWLGVLLAILIICGAIYISERRRIPALIVALTVASVLFFQVGKEEFRKTYWTEEEQGGKLERVEFWINASLEKWDDALSNPSSKTIKDATYPSLGRVALLTQAADVIDLTPSVVPYQYGSLYTYLVIGFIPRFFWPDKPSVNEANQFYQVAYGVTDESNLGKVSIAIGMLTESYINFGWFGVFPIMFLLGVFLDFYQKTSLSTSSGALMSGIGFAMLPHFLAIESQLAIYMGGIIQSLIMILLVMLPIISFKETSARLKIQPILLSR